MYQSIISGAYHGSDSYLISVEVDVSAGLPCMEMIGYLASEVKESRERVRVGIKNSGYKILPQRITISLSPADIRKNGSGFDLPVAVGIVLAMGENGGRTDKVLVLGELGLDGTVKTVSGVLPIVMKAAEEGVKVCLIPKGNYNEARLVRGITVIPVSTLREAVEKYLAILEGKTTDQAPESESSYKSPVNLQGDYKVDFNQVAGQQQAVRAAEIAAAGLHNILLFGPPGSGKTMIAERMCTILPPMTYEECLEVTKIRSILGELNEKETLVTKRPFEVAHHMITPQGLLGGGVVPIPGIISRAHKGVLFLDELAEFGRAKLDLLRQPIEEKKIHIVRNKYSCEYRTDFMLVAAMNPCPCGYFPDRSRCNCRSAEIAAYLKRVSGPLLDRIDISVEVGKVNWGQINEAAKRESSAKICQKVCQAYEIQQSRQNKLNSNLTSEELDRFCNMDSAAESLLKKTFQKKEKSVRCYDRIRRIARTIADLDESFQVKGVHMAEAIVLNGGMEAVLRNEVLQRG